MRRMKIIRGLREVADRCNREQAWRMGLIAVTATYEIERLYDELEEANAEIDRLRREKRDEIVQGFSP